MMMERPKPTTATVTKERDEQPRPEIISRNEKEEKSKTIDPIELLEKRLAKLGGDIGLPAAGVPEQDESPTSSFIPPAVASAPLETKLAQSEQHDTAAMNKMMLLKRIQEGRERASLAQQRLKEHKEKEEMDRQAQQQKQVAELVSVGQQQEEDKIYVPPPSYDEIQAVIEPVRDVNLTTERQGTVSFNEEKAVIIEETTYAIPSAPPAEDYMITPNVQYKYSMEDELLPPPPSYEELERGTALVQTTEPTDYVQEEAPDSGAAFDYDAFGNLITTGEKQRMENEQRQILELIQRENAEKTVVRSFSYNDTARSVSHVLPQSAINRAAAAVSSVPSNTATMTTNSTMPTVLSAPKLNVVTATDVELQQRPFRMVNMGPGQQVRVLDQSKTRDAIINGTAVLVECVGCSQWMQVANSATLMFCPCCETVVPVVTQSKVKTREEAIRLTRDRQLAEKLQNEFTLEDERAAVAAATKIAATETANITPSEQQSSNNELSFGSWREYVSAIFTTAPTQTGDQRSGSATTTTTTSQSPFSYPAEARVGQENVSSANSSQQQQQKTRQLYTAQIVGNEEDRGSNNDEEATGLLPARVAMPQPNLFSCVEKSFSTVVSSIGRFGYSEEKRGDVDEEMLALTNRDMLLREETTGSSEYHRLLDSEDDINVASR